LEYPVVKTALAPYRWKSSQRSTVTEIHSGSSDRPNQIDRTNPSFMGLQSWDLLRYHGV